MKFLIHYPSQILCFEYLTQNLYYLSPPLCLNPIFLFFSTLPKKANNHVIPLLKCLVDQL